MLLGSISRCLWRATARRSGAVPEEVVTYKGRIRIDPADAYGEGSVQLANNGSLVDYLYEHLDVPTEGGFQMPVNLYARVTVEVFPEPNPNWWP